MRRHFCQDCCCEDNSLSVFVTRSIAVVEVNDRRINGLISRVSTWWLDAWLYRCWFRAALIVSFCIVDNRSDSARCFSCATRGIFPNVAAVRSLKTASDSICVSCLER